MTADKMDKMMVSHKVAEMVEMWGEDLVDPTVDLMEILMVWMREILLVKPMVGKLVP